MGARYVVEHLNHLGIVAEVCREIGVADWLDHQEPGNRQHVSVGTATVALVLNAHILQFAEARFWGFRGIAPQIRAAPGLELNMRSSTCSPLACLLPRRANENARADETTLGSEAC